MLYGLYYFGLDGFRGDERGAAAIEYGLIASLVSVAVIIALNLAGESLRDLYTLIANALLPGS
jgi:pilus assembly protein Flp/PilA